MLCGISCALVGYLRSKFNYCSCQHCCERCRVGLAEELIDEPDEVDEEVQTDQPLPLLVDTGTPARIRQLQREMVDLKRQAQLTEVVTYAMLPVAAVLMLLFGGKLWAVMHTGVSLAK